MRGFCETFLLCATGLLSLLAVPSAVLAQDAAPPSGASIVKPNSYVSLDRVPRGQAFQVAVVVNIANGYHMNSHKPTDAYLIPTTLTAQLPAGFTLADTVYPAGHLEKFAFSPSQPLDVYTGSVTLRMKLNAQAAAPLGHSTIPMVLRYQACNQTTCLPPVKVPVSVEVQVVEAGAASHPVHSEIFSALGTSGK
jgi:thiol:disulfide interchange protein DsbD